MQGLCALRIFRIANTKKHMRKFQTQCAETLRHYSKLFKIIILFVYIHNKNKTLCFCEIKETNRMLFLKTAFFLILLID